jgi:hypothetical protein
MRTIESYTAVSPHLRYFADRLAIPFLYQIVRDASDDRMVGPVRVMPASKFLMGLV